METRKPTTTRRAAVLGLLGLCVAGFSEAQAQTRRERLRERRRQRRQQRRERRERQRQDWDAARDAVRRGEIEPLRVLMRYFEDKTGFEVIDVRYRRAGGQHFYGFKVLTTNGRLKWYAINAATREIMSAAEARERYGQ